MEFESAISTSFKFTINGRHVGLQEIEEYAEEVKRMKEEVKALINSEEMDPLSRLELIDCVQRLGLGYHFVEQISKALSSIYDEPAQDLEDLHSVAVRFRLLRQHKFSVRQGTRSSPY